MRRGRGIERNKASITLLTINILLRSGLAISDRVKLEPGGSRKLRCQGGRKLRCSMSMWTMSSKNTKVKLSNLIRSNKAYKARSIPNLVIKTQKFRLGRSQTFEFLSLFEGDRTYIICAMDGAGFDSNQRESRVHRTIRI